LLPSYAVANQTASWGFNGDDTVILYTGGTYDFANVMDAFGWTNTTGAADTSFVRKNTISTGVNTDFNAADWDQFTLDAVNAALESTNERLGYHSTTAPTFGVTFDKLNGFIVVEGSSATITATAANGTEPYAYAWSSTLGGAYYTAVDNVFTILATAPAGDYSATVEATDASPLTVTNTINFSVKTPYAITITPPTNGTVTTTPAGSAIEGTTVTITATPDASYVVGPIEVLDETMTPSPVTGNTFVMPASPVTVTVEFVYHEPSDLIISEVADPGDNVSARFVELYNAGSTSIDLAAGTWFLARQINGGTWNNVALTGTVAAGSTYVVAVNSTGYPAAYPLAPAPDQISGIPDGNGDDGYFLFSGGNNAAGILEDAYGVINLDGSGTEWDYLDSRAARNSGVVQGNPTWTASEWTITNPANVADMTPGVHPDGPVVFGVTFDKTDGFVVAEGVSDAITATAANGTEPYAYAWSSTLDGAYYTAVDNVFTILATAPAGSYSADVVATDATPQSVTNMINFTVAAAAATNPPIASITFVAGTGFTFEVPGGYALSRVEGADAVVAGNEFTWTTLSSPTDYTVSGTTVTILRAAAERRMVRIWLTP